MPAKSIAISGHARFEMQRRGVTETEVTAVIRNPGQVLAAPKGRQICQSKIAGGRMLLRVVVKEEDAAYHIITAYKTSKVGKYWSQT